MNGNPPETVPWSLRRWVTVVLTVLALQFVLFYLLAPRVTVSGRQTEAGLKIRWLANPALAKRTLDTLLLEDSTLLAIASPRGFSGAAWLRPSTQEFRVSEWSDADRPLTQPTQSLGGAFRFVESAANQPAFDPARKPAVAAPGVLIAPPVLRVASRLLVQGDLARRPLEKVPPLRSWSHTDLLTDTRVQVIVSAEGLVISPRLTGATAARNLVQQAADRHALDVARTLRFAPLPRAGNQGPGTLGEGVLVFQWHTTEPPANVKE